MRTTNKPLFIVYVIFLFVIHEESDCQEEYIFTPMQITNNQYLYNPAIAGMKKFGRLSLAVQQSLLRIEGSPRTQLLSFQNRLMKNVNRLTLKRGYKTESTNIGIGSYIFNDVDGPFRNIGFSASFTYHIDLNSKKTEQVSFGLGPVILVESVNNQYINTQNDPLFHSDKLRGIAPDFSAGIQYFGKYAYLGISSVQIFAQPMRYNDELTNSKNTRKIFVNGGGKYELMRRFYVEPSFLFYSLDGELSEFGNYFDVNLAVYYSFLKITGTYRNNESVSVSGIAQFDHFFVEVAYELPFGKTFLYNYGYSKLAIGYNFGKGPNRFKDQRYW